MSSYVDTSVLVAALTNEPATTLTQDWLAGRAAGDLVISDWVITEFSSALALKLRSEHLVLEQRADILAAFHALIQDSLHVIPLVRADYTTAANFADQFQLSLRAGDALHLAVSSRLGACLVSLDKVLVAAADRLGVDARMLA